ncbi:MAG: MFS transporter [Pyrinomonadaceae bacterium]
MATQGESGLDEAKSAGGLFRALSHRNYRLFWTGALLSNVGTWMQVVAQGWLVLSMTDSPFYLGLDAFMATAPGLLFTLAGGVFADLVDRRRLLIYTQIGAGLSALAFAVLISTQVVRPNDFTHVWIVFVLSFFTGCCMALASPSYQAITIDLVGREDLPNAIALNSTQFQFSRIVGPAMAGVALSVFGLAGCFYANAFSYVAVVTALALVRFERNERDGETVRATKDTHALWNDLIEGFKYVRKRPRVFMLLSISAVTSLFGAPYFALVPYFARNIFHLGETGLATMMGVAGAGAFFGALFLVLLGNFRYKGWFVLGGAFFFSLALIGFSLSTDYMLSLIFLFFMGFAIVCSVAVINTLLQQLVTNEMRGRVMSMFILSFMGAMPVGNLLAGAAAQRYGAPHTLAAGGLVIALFVAYVAIGNKRLRGLR